MGKHRTPPDKRKQKTKQSHSLMRERFVQEYLKDPTSGKAAAIRAGYSERSAKGTASRLLQEPDIAARVDQMRQEAQARTEITVDYVLRNLKENLERCMQARPVVDFRGNVSEGEWTHDAKEANKACELLGKYLGMYTEKKQLNVTHEGPAPVFWVLWEGENAEALPEGRVAEYQPPALPSANGTNGRASLPGGSHVARDGH